MKDYEGAIIDFNKAIAINDKNFLTYDNRGYVFFLEGKTDQALADINKSIQMDESNAFAYKNRALVYIKLKNTEKACSDIEKAMELNYTKLYGDDIMKLKAAYCK